ncbi:MAG: hypothetical protein H6699_12365 [Myxococcales bacterium]|nr:hypothetical protein [Myxococcales bacterium]
MRISAGPERIAVFALLAALAPLAGCGTAASGTRIDRDDVAADVSDADAAAIDVTPLEDPGADLVPDAPDLGDIEVDTSDTPPPLAAPGEPCVDDADCESELCVVLDVDSGASVCSGRCTTDVDCPNGFRCTTVGGVDLTRVCLPDDLCVDADFDRHGIGPGCDGDDCDDADPSRFVGADETCDGLDNDCDGEIDERTLEEGADCDSGFAGVCAAGRTRCEAGLLLCESAVAASPERCDNVDNDCDGTVDLAEDGTPLRRACYTGPTGTSGVGACHDGFSMCDDGGFVGCDGQATPVGEICNGVDDDCDGATDDRPSDVGFDCDSGALGACALGRTLCLDGTLLCVSREDPVTERCDGVDDDCDGSIDEDELGDPLSRECYGGPAGTAGVGACVAGAQLCVDGAYAGCEGEVRPTVETCNGIDDDCDGEPDDRPSDVGLDCDSGALGVCAPGRTTCLDGELQCVSRVEPTVERCDGVDEDCDGVVDEDDFGAPLARECYGGPVGTAGVGVCVAGAQLCVDGTYASCEGEVRPSPEVCNGLNDDCDADGADEGDPGGGLVCSTGLFGRCAPGLTHCSGGRIECVQNAAAVPETCDGSDEDCDGLVDALSDGSPLTRACYSGAAGTAGVGICRAGTQTCSSAVWGGCASEVVPRTEVCSGLDEDCDAATDEGCPTAVVVAGDAAGPQFGGSGGDAFSDTCPAGQVLVGVDARVGSRLDRVAGICASVALVEDRGTSPYRYSVSINTTSTLTGHGGTGGTPTSYVCPTGQVVTGIRGRQGSEIDALVVACSTVTVTGAPGSFGISLVLATTSPALGGTGGAAFSFDCGAGGVVRGLFGRSGARVDGVGARCGTLSLSTR